MPDTRPFLELDHAQERKHGQAAAGDAFLCTKLEKGERLVCVLRGRPFETGNESPGE